MAVQKEKIKHLNQILCPLVISKRAWVYKWRNKVTANHTLTLIRH